MPSSTSQAFSRCSPRYLFVGAAAIVIEYLAFVPQNPVRPQGALGEHLEREARGAASAAGLVVNERGCEMHGSMNVGVSCRVAPDPLGHAIHRLQQLGWRPISGPPLASPPQEAAFIRGEVRLSLTAKGSNDFWSVSASRVR
jgi:hypothetical protein